MTRYRVPSQNGEAFFLKRTGGSLSVTESPKVTAEEERVEAAPTKDTDISGLRELG